MNIADVDFGFLFGAGTSQAFEMCSTKCITDIVLNSKTAYRDSGGRFCMNDGLGGLGDNGKYMQRLQRKPAQRVQEFLRILFKYIEMNNLRCPNFKSSLDYESIYYLASRLADGLRRPYADPAFPSLFDDLVGQLVNFGTKRLDLLNLASSGLDFIRDIVSGILWDCKEEFYTHKFLVDAHQARDSKPLDVFTLNHDLQIEGYCSANGIDLEDGFAEPRGMDNIREWAPDRFDMNSHCLRLFKLHGGVDWHYWSPNDMPNDQVLGISTVRKFYDIRISGKIPRLPNCPVILVGMRDKLLEYSRAAHFEMFCAAKKAWDKLNLLIVVGYSFRDQGINRFLYHWGDQRRPRKLLIIPRSKERLLNSASPVFSGFWRAEWEGTKQLFFYEKDFESLRWDELVRFSKTIWD